MVIFGTRRKGAARRDFNPTILHLPGRDHTRLTCRLRGRDFRLTDLHGGAVGEILA